MPLTIRDALKFGGLFGSTLLAGVDGLNHVIESVSILEIAESKIARWVIQNQMYITSFYAIWDNVDMQKTVIRTLSDCGCCGLVICNLGTWIQSVDQSIIDLCNDTQFPLIAAREDVSYIEIQNPILNILFQEKQDTLSGMNYSNIRNDFLDIIINEDNTEHIFSIMAARLNRQISFYDIYCGEIYSNKDKSYQTEENKYISKNFNRILHYSGEDGYMSMVIAGRKQLVTLIRSRKNLFGIIAIDDIHSTLSENPDSAKQLAISAALVLSRREKISDFREKEIQEYIADLIVWNFPTYEIAISRGLEMGYHIENMNRVVLLNINTIQMSKAEGQKEMQEYIRTVLLPETQKELQKHYPTGELAFRSDTIILFLTETNNTSDILSMCYALKKLFCGQPKLSVSIGVSECFQRPNGIPAAYSEAFNAAILGRNHFGENKVTLYEQIWFFQKLHELGDDEQAQSVCHRLLLPLTEYDAQHHTQLTETFRYLLRENGIIDKVATQMFVHKNTILQRKNKIISLYEQNPFEMPQIMNYLMALEILS